MPLELGNAGLNWITLVPEFGDNRSLPENERLSLKIKKLTSVDVLSITNDDAALEYWRDSRLAKQLKDPELAPKILNFSTSILQVYKQFVENTQDWKNLYMDGVEVTDPVEIFLRLPVSLDPDDASLVAEVNNAIAATANLYGEQLKNFARQCGGSTQEQGALPVNTETSTP